MNSLQRMNRMENRQDTLEATVKMYIQRMDERDRQTREELRAMNERQEAHIREMNEKREADMREMREKREADMKAMRERQEAMEAKREADLQAMRERQEAMEVKREAMEAKREADLQTMREKREQDRKELYELVDRLDKKIDSKFDGLMKHLQTLTVSAVVGVGAIIVAIVIYTK